VRRKRNSDQLPGCTRSALAFFNFCGIHSAIREPHAIEVKIADQLWDLTELLASAYRIRAFWSIFPGDRGQTFAQIKAVVFRSYMATNRPRSPCGDNS